MFSINAVIIIEHDDIISCLYYSSGWAAGVYHNAQPGDARSQPKSSRWYLQQ